MQEESISRRSFIQLSAGGLAVAATGSSLLTESARAAALPARGGTLTMGITGDPATLDVHRSTLDVLRHTIRSMVFEGLVFVRPNLQIAPQLAESWRFSNGGRTVTFRLRPGVVFHDGTPFTAHDVAFTVHRVQSKATASQYAPQVASVARVEVVDRYTVRFHLNAPTPDIVLNMLFVPIVSQKSVGSIQKHPIGTGPFKFVEWIPGSHLTVVRNPHYWRKGLPLLDQIIMRPIGDDQARITNLQTNAIQLDESLNATDVQQIRGIANAKVVTTKPITLYEIFQINTSKAPFNDKRVRQALSYAFDRKAYTASFWSGLARPGDTPFVKEMPAYFNGADNVYTFNLNKTAALLKEAGFSSSHPLQMEILNPAGFSTLHAMSVLLQNNLNKLGHHVTVRDLELSAWIDRISAHADFDITTDNYNTVPQDPGGMFNSDNLAPSFNINRFNPPGYAALVHRAATAVNPGKQNQLYRELERLILDEQPMIVVDHIPNLLGASKRISGLILGPSGVWDFSHVTLS